MQQPIENLKCPLTGKTENLKIVDVIPTSEIIQIYRRCNNVDITNEFSCPNVYLVKNEEINFCFFYPFKSGSSSFYDDISQDAYYNPEKEEFKIAANYVSQNDSVLDVGCGWGCFKNYLPDVTYLGLEFSQSSIKKCQEKNIPVTSETIQSFAKKPQKFSIVTAFQVIEHIENPLEFFEALKEATAEGGLIIVSVPNMDSNVVIDNSHLNIPPHHISWWSKEAMLYLGRKLNLELVDIHIAKSPCLRTFFSILGQWKLNLILGRKQKLISNSIIDRISFRLFSQIGKFFKNPPKELLPNGHSLTVVYKKRN